MGTERLLTGITLVLPVSRQVSSAAVGNGGFAQGAPSAWVRTVPLSLVRTAHPTPELQADRA